MSVDYKQNNQQGAYERISAKDKPQIISSQYLCLGPRKDSRVIYSQWEIRTNIEPSGTEIGMNCTWPRERKTRLVPAQLIGGNVKYGVANKEDEGWKMSGLLSHTKDLDSTLWLIGSHLWDLNKGITWSSLYF